MEKEYILVVEDDIDIKDILVFNLIREGYEVADAENGLACLEKVRADKLRNKKPDLILLDVMMPEMDGLTTSKELAKIGNFPLVFLTAKGEEIDRIVGLELGAEDYVVKPFSIRELLLRIKTILRRGKKHKNIESNELKKDIENHIFLERNGVCIDNNSHKVLLKDQEIHVTLTEFKLLEDLMRHAQLVRTREQLLESVWGYQFDGYNRTVDTHMRRLRQKLGDTEEFIETVRGLGYRMK